MQKKSSSSADSLSEETILIPDCLELVFKHLETADKGRAARVCRLWKEACYRRSVWKREVANIRLTFTSEDAIHSIRCRGIRKIRVKEHGNNLEKLIRGYSTLQCFSIKGCYYTSDDTLVRAFGETSNQTSELKELDLSFCTRITDVGFHCALSSNLTSLSLKACTNIRFTDSTRETLKKCRHLEELDLAGCKQVKFSSLSGIFGEDGIHNLKTLNLQDCDHICDMCLKYVSETQPNLESLNLSFCISVSDDGMSDIAKNLSNLTTLHLRAMDNVTSRGLSHIANSSISLRKLDVAFCEWFDDGCMQKMASGRTSQTLEDLDLSCNPVTDAGTKAMAESMLRLRHLKIGQCKRLSNASLSHIAAHLTNLKSIDTYGCNFSSIALSQLRSTLRYLTTINIFIIPTQ